MARAMGFSGAAYTSVEFMALARLLFGREFRNHYEGSRAETQYYLPADAKIVYYCEACDRDFTSVITPTVCPLCQAKAEDLPQSNTLTHNGTGGGVHTAKVFPFFVPA